MRSSPLESDNFARLPVVVRAAAASPRVRDGVVLGLFIVFTGLVYSAAVRFPTRSPSFLPRLPGEDHVPLLPWSAWVYLSYFGLVLYAGGRILGHREFGRCLLACLAVVTGCVLVFLVFPTALPRALPAGGNPWALEVIRENDPPLGCFPSMHVGLATLCVLLVRTARREETWLAAGWAGLVVLSTLTTGQHCLLDVLGGLALAGLAWLAVRRFFAGRGLRRRVSRLLP